MENVTKYFLGALGSLFALLAPVRPLVACAMIFIAVDFVTGVAADRRRAKLCGVPWGFESRKAWSTVVKLWLVMCGIVMAWLIDDLVLGFMSLNLARLFTGFVCGVELWSYLENAAQISDHPIFLKLRKMMKRQLHDRLGMTDDDDNPT